VKPGHDFAIEGMVQSEVLAAGSKLSIDAIENRILPKYLRWSSR
jgi:hypothetical protein